MNISTLNFPPIIPDNDICYLRLLEAFLNSTDESCSAEVTCRLSSIGVRIAPSTPDYSQHILETIKEMHYMLGLRVQFSKSIRTSSTVDYMIENI